MDAITIKVYKSFRFLVVINLPSEHVQNPTAIPKSWKHPWYVEAIPEMYASSRFLIVYQHSDVTITEVNISLPYAIV